MKFDMDKKKKKKVELEFQRLKFHLYRTHVSETRVPFEKSWNSSFRDSSFNFFL